MLCNIILTVNFVRSGLFPTGHVSLTWEHRVFVPSAEGSPEKRRACHTHHWNLLSLWPNTAGHLRVTPHPFAYRAHSASPQPQCRHPTRSTSISQTTMHGQPHPFQAKLRAISYLAYKQLRTPRFRSDCALSLNSFLPPVCSHGRKGTNLIKAATKLTQREEEGTAREARHQAHKGTVCLRDAAPDTEAAAGRLAQPAPGQVTALPAPRKQTGLTARAEETTCKQAQARGAAGQLLPAASTAPSGQRPGRGGAPTCCPPLIDPSSLRLTGKESIPTVPSDRWTKGGTEHIHPRHADGHRDAVSL